MTAPLIPILETINLALRLGIDLRESYDRDQAQLDQAALERAIIRELAAGQAIDRLIDEAIAARAGKG